MKDNKVQLKLTNKVIIHSFLINIQFTPFFSLMLKTYTKTDGISVASMFEEQSKHWDAKDVRDQKLQKNHPAVWFSHQILQRKTLLIDFSTFCVIVKLPGNRAGTRGFSVLCSTMHELWCCSGNVDGANVAHDFRVAKDFGLPVVS